ncbi:hypothetical protein AC579_1965 [Pseudocercospora musae]|uniref:Uncharacterized protein n=1 Tax=Pseudocercospora musae TaxID=113226 RepID=A0A139I7Y5_9PEZI|nr:hypothetical protein AC579_1965 [Pseudocercospora musae]
MPITNGYHNPVANDDDPRNTPDGTTSIAPSSAHSSSRQAYISKITIPLNDTPAWTPTQKLRKAIIGAGYSGMVMAQEL